MHCYPDALLASAAAVKIHSPNWSAALNQFAILFEGRVPMGGLNQNSLTQTA